MRRFLALFMVVGFVLGVTFSAAAAVQHVRIGGELRTRVYLTRYLDNLGPEDEEEFYFMQRSRLTTEVDLTEMVMGVATVEARGMWGRNIEQEDGEWNMNVAEAYIQLSEVFYSPITLKLGRQYLHYGRGFLISSREWEYNFDAVRTIFDLYPWTVDLFFSRLVETDPATPKAFDDRDLFGVNLNYSSEFWTLEGYVFGIRDAAAEVSGTAKDAPVTIGIRGDASPVQALDVWGELSYQLGKYEPLADESEDIRALAFDVGGVYIFDVSWEPALALSYIYASGNKEDSDKREAFNPLYNYNYYGYAFSPRLSNIGIVNAQLSFIPSPSTLMIFDFFLYQQAQKAKMVMGDPNKDNGGVSVETTGDEKDLGMELDAIFEYNYSEDLSTRLVGAWFKPGDAYKTALNPDPKDAVEARLEFKLTF